MEAKNTMVFKSGEHFLTEGLGGGSQLPHLRVLAVALGHKERTMNALGLFSWEKLGIGRKVS